MKKYLIGIFLGLSLVFSFGGIKGEKMQQMQDAFAVSEQYVAEEGTLSPASWIWGDFAINSFFSFDTFYLKICEVPTAVSLAARGSNFFRTMRFLSPIRVLSSLDVPLVEKNSGEEYSHYNFSKTSYRYYVYTLRRLLI